MPDGWKPGKDYSEKYITDMVKKECSSMWDAPFSYVRGRSAEHENGEDQHL
jgi:hypothetical protein